MAPDSSILDQLTRFQERDLFSADAWQARGLNPSSADLSRELTNFFHRCAKQLAEGLAAGSPPRQLKTILTTALSQLDKRLYDTEEREFIADLFGELAAIVGADIRGAVNRWLYGPVLTALLTIMRFLRPERVIETLSQPCSQCGTPLETQILRKRSDIPDAQWLIIRCKRCRELNLLSPGPGIAQLRFGNYEWVESLSKEEYNQEQALMRLEQIRYFRKTLIQVGINLRLRSFFKFSAENSFKTSFFGIAIPILPKAQNNRRLHFGRRSDAPGCLSSEARNTAAFP